MKLEFAPIGVIHSPHRQMAGTPLQPRYAEAVEGTVELLPEFALGLRDLDGFERIWLLFWCHRACAARLTVVPYRDKQTRGVFATRAPSRPNPIGLSCVRLLGIAGAVLRVADLDMLDGTPVLDIKPYLPDCDVYTVERVGWYAQAHGACVADDRFSQGPESRPS